VNNLRQVSVSEQTPVYQPNKILNSLQIDDNSSFFAVSFSRVKDINTSLYNQHKRPFISYALKNGNNVMSVDLDRKDAPYAVPLFAHLDNVG